ncbi:MAG: xanthine phosphoribosyltransferase [Clostridia bacterium]|nr:xanthine phosphoribosyltransferase [Clostridia bacterium]
MKLLEDRIVKDGKCLSADILKVDSFLNHQIDVTLLDEIGKEFARLYQDGGVNKILTIEASGIAIACLTARHFNAPVVFAKKSKTSNISNDVYTAEVPSYTHGNVNTVMVSKQYLNAGDRVLIVDDFLANGCALNGLVNLVEAAGATVVGAGIVIEKAYQGGGDALRARGVRVESLARIASMDAQKGVTFIR